ncbi:MAG: hypothetical protein BZY88_05685 [SAR202 cluster bacterium Io17-Chloro-G9]|nr:MAG: hypothetical protein BZY88_05685 [SAR202 cluster bacterium Io17-Chloro-G9]
MAALNLPTTSEITFTVNAQSRSLTVRHHWTMLDGIRESLDFTGAKRGYDRGERGACPLLLDNKPVYACQLLAMQVAGSSVVNIEGLAKHQAGR